ncbi:thioesterase II family protein [Actinomadura gamaensis]|uniref:Thioesterase II family protein n=1 Tax=Actinomadura gamaensis TaxID=1763541 RepID=A0ABV9TXH0_9ACTN
MSGRAVSGGAARAGSGRWLVRRRPPPDARADLYCFPHAGGMPGEYARWADHLPDVRVSAVQFPGRGSRPDEPPSTRMGALVEALASQVTFGTDGVPFALFGHSLGALVAFEVVRALRSRGLRRPDLLCVSSCPAPPLSPVRERMHELPDGELLAEIERRWGALPEQVRADPDLLAPVLGRYRADFAVLETYEFEPGEPLDVPILALTGADDGNRPERVRDWRRHTQGKFAFRVLPGGHFHFRERPGEAPRLVRAALVQQSSTSGGVFAWTG